MSRVYFDKQETDDFLKNLRLIHSTIHHTVVPDLDMVGAGTGITQEWRYLLSDLEHEIVGLIHKAEEEL